ncbi:MAG: ABC transporter substrate-binding protein, partial [Bacteroidota bacterium]
DGLTKDISGTGEINFESLIECGPDVLLVYPFGFENEAKYSEAGVQCFPIAEYLEDHPLGKAEWIKVIGFLLNDLDNANKIYSQMEELYLAEVQQVTDGEKPTVFTGSYSGGQWFAPGANTFMAQFIRDAGGEYLFEDKKTSENIQLSFEELYIKALDADYWGKIIYEPGNLTLDQLAANDDRFTKLKSFQEKQVFYCNVAETDYFGMAVLEPHLILKDLKRILHDEPSEIHYFKLIDQE